MNTHHADLPTGTRVAIGHHDCAALVTGKLPLPTSPKNTSTPRSANAPPIASETCIVHHLSRHPCSEQYYCMTLYPCREASVVAPTFFRFSPLPGDLYARPAGFEPATVSLFLVSESTGEVGVGRS